MELEAFITIIGIGVVVIIGTGLIIKYLETMFDRKVEKLVNVVKEIVEKQEVKKNE